jgi:Rhs element Vgr protein
MSNNRVIPTKGADTVVTATLKVEGQAVPKTVEVMDIRVALEINRIGKASITILDGEPAKGDFPLSNLDLFVPGKRIEVFVGHQSDEQLIFNGIIVQHDISIRQRGGAVLKLDCRDEAIKLTLTRKNRYFAEQTDSSAIDDILAEAGLEAELEDTQVIQPQLVQYYATDWDFMLTRAEVNGMYCYFDGRRMRVQRPRFDAEPKLSLAYGATIKQLDAGMSARTQYSAVRTLSWDPSGQELLEGEAVAPEMQEQGNFSADLLAQALGGEALRLQHSGNMGIDALHSWADAGLMRSRMAKVRGVVKSGGTASVWPGDMIQLSGVGERFNGPAFVSGVHHFIGNGKWDTSFQFGYTPRWFSEERQIQAPLNAGLSPAVSGLQIGVVTQLQGDPNGNFRIQVRMPLLGNADGAVWARIAAPDAGQNRGFVFRPEIGDEVVLGFVNNDPAYPVVLGALHSGAKPAPVDAADANHGKGYTSRSSMRLHFDDDKKALQLDTPAGNKLVLSEQDRGITIEDQNGNKIVLSSSGISIESASALNLKANTQLKAQGQAGAELSSDALTTIKGVQVFIN